MLAANEELYEQAWVVEGSDESGPLLSSEVVGQQEVREQDRETAIEELDLTPSDPSTSADPVETCLREPCSPSISESGPLPF